LIVVDGMISQGGSIDVFNPVDVETVEILRGTNSTIYGVAAGVGGVMVVTTRQGGAAPGVISKEMAPGIYSFTPNGFYKAREFYSPQYDASATAAKVPDTRTTIFWKPDVITDTNGNASFNFFNADGAGIYRVVIEGIDSEGNLGRLVYKYKVE
ncbi:MAG: TonB-dependent receptor plug domain-containing protein, partial [Mucilaginibacter sp.]